MEWLTPKREGDGPADAAMELVGVRTTMAAAMALAAEAAVRSCRATLSVDRSAAITGGTDREWRSTESVAPRDQLLKANVRSRKAFTMADGGLNTSDVFNGSCIL